MIDSTKNFLRYVRACIYKIIWFILGICPVNPRKIFTVSFYGKGYSDNPKYILNEMIKQRLNYSYYWAVKDTKINNELPKEIKAIKYESLSYIYHMRTAGIWIDNCRKPLFILKKKNQFYLNSYHALPFKKIEKDAEVNLGKFYVNLAIHDSRIVDLYISGSRFMTNLYQNSFWYDGPVSEVGSPRNDPLLKIDKTIVNGIRNKLNIKENIKILLYAPTFRRDGNLEVYNLDFHKTMKALKDRFDGEWVTFYKLHPNIAKKSRKNILNTENIIDVSQYNDMQELLLVADALITDYSSSIFDYILTKKPVFIYATDFEAYQKDRSIYFDFKDLPFKLNSTVTELTENILNFDSNIYVKKCNSFMDMCGYKENGTASKAIVEICNNYIAKAS